jgi:cytoskeletal protein RodZ
MKRGMIDRNLSFGVLAGVLTFSFGLNAFADSEASMQGGAEASSQNASEASRQNSSSANTENSRSAQTSNSSSAARQNHSEASVEAGRPTYTNQIPVRTTNNRVSAIQPGIRTVNNSRHAARRHHSGSSSRSYMINTIQQAARSK